MSDNSPAENAVSGCDPVASNPESSLVSNVENNVSQNTVTPQVPSEDSSHENSNNSTDGLSRVDANQSQNNTIQNQNQQNLNTATTMPQLPPVDPNTPITPISYPIASNQYFNPLSIYQNPMLNPYLAQPPFLYTMQNCYPQQLFPVNPMAMQNCWPLNPPPVNTVPHSSQVTPVTSNQGGPQRQSNIGSDTASNFGIIEIPATDTQQSTGTPQTVNSNSYLALKTAEKIVPNFDGNVKNLAKFIKKCKTANESVKPEDRKNLLRMICNKISGYADDMLQTRDDPKTLDELINSLKNIYSRNFDLKQIQTEFHQLKQKENESIESYGNRVLQILNRGLEAARIEFSNIDSVKILLTSTAISCFTNGLRDLMVGSLLRSENPLTIENAIDRAARIEQGNSDQMQQIKQANVKPTTSNAKIFTVTGHEHERKSRRDDDRPRASEHRRESRRDDRRHNDGQYFSASRNNSFDRRNQNYYHRDYNRRDFSRDFSNYRDYSNRRSFSNQRDYSNYRNNSYRRDFSHNRDNSNQRGFSNQRDYSNNRDNRQFNNNNNGNNTFGDRDNRNSLNSRAAPTVNHPRSKLLVARVESDEFVSPSTTPAESANSQT